MQKQMKVVVAQPIAEAGTRALCDAGFVVEKLLAHDEATLADAVVHADGLLVRDAHVTRKVLEAGKAKLRVIARHGAGLDRIDLASATELGIQVTNTPIANSSAVAEHALGMMLSLAKNFLVTDPENRKGHFDIRHERYGIDLEGKTLGLLGFGSIGRRLARMAGIGLGMRVVVYDPFADRASADVSVDWADDVQSVFAVSDVISVHTPLTDATRGLIDAGALKQMKKTAFLINCARGPVVVEADLVAALKDGTIAGAGIDVYDPDPPQPDNALFGLENVIVTPHTAAHTFEAMRNMATQAAQGIIEVLGGRKPTWPANAVSTNEHPED